MNRSTDQRIRNTVVSHLVFTTPQGRPQKIKIDQSNPNPISGTTPQEAATERRPMKDLAVSRGHIKPAAKLGFDFPGRTAHFDNSANNPLNSDPSKQVGWGDPSWDERRVGFHHVAFDAKMPLRELFPSTREPRPEVAQ